MKDIRILQVQNGFIVTGQVNLRLGDPASQYAECASVFNSINDLCVFLKDYFGEKPKE
jgi:hypothetical protein